jgi:hypothetical protein
VFVLIGCGSAKTTEPCAAKDLYTGSLFRYRRRYAERFGTDGWMILSAKHGLVYPDTLVEPYDLRVSMLTRAERQVWADGVGEQIRRLHLMNTKAEIHAGMEYRQPLAHWLVDWGRPLQHMGIGQQLRWYKQKMDDLGVEPSLGAL